MASPTTRLANLTSHLSTDPTVPTPTTHPFERMIRFESFENGKSFFGHVVSETMPHLGDSIEGFPSFEDFLQRSNGKTLAIVKFLAPLPYDAHPIYCIGVNYKLHAKEAKLEIPKRPMLWLKGAAALAAPEEDVHINAFCASSWPDYEGEFVFVTSKECRDLSPEEAEPYILGYSVGNDLSCRIHQAPEEGGGQYVFSKGFDKFGPVGPALVSPQELAKKDKCELITRVNGEERQRANIFEEFIWSPSQILSHMSQGTTIPAGTAVMTGTPSGVGYFKNQKLKHEDIVEVEVSGIGILRNKIVYV